MTGRFVEFSIAGLVQPFWRLQAIVCGLLQQVLRYNPNEAEQTPKF